MKRAFCVLAALRTEQKQSVLGKMLPVTNFKEWKFRSTPNYAALPIDENPEYNVPMAVKDAVFSKVPTEPLAGTLHLVCASDDALTDLLDLHPSVAETADFINFFGHWADQLGDGRAHILGEYVNSKGESWQPQLKGSGETPYSRFGDGRAVLRSSIREMIASEACYYLGIPTTRAAALVVSDDHKVWRDKTYSGRAKQERAAIVMRLANAWYRIGSLEILLKRREPHTLKLLTDFIIKHHFPEIENAEGDKYVNFYKEVAFRNLDMVATWQGVTIDYGPYGFIDHYYHHFVPNTSDDMGRYAFNKQPEILLWNLEKLAEAMEPILSAEQKQEIDRVEATLEKYVKTKVLKTYLHKLGLEEIQDGDQKLVDDLLEVMQLKMADFTATFRQLAEVEPKQLSDETVLGTKWSLSKLIGVPAWDKWVRFLVKLFKNPYEVNEEAEKRGYSAQPPSWSYGLKLSCSS
ncbi:hypothetical protein SFRURICE_012744 [Spodoptera frugiperda]|nr:hypothetical protein SFRURICE_012744 [Spodoptera frugiperda]